MAGIQLSSWLSILKSGLSQLLYPNTCWICGQFFADVQARLCPPCEKILTTDPEETCPRCASRVGPHVNVEAGCGRCRQEKFAFDRALRLVTYDGMLREVVLRLKNSRDEILTEVIAELWARHMAPRLREFAPQAVVPVPLHWTRRYWERGFNQSEILARFLAKSLAIPCYPASVRQIPPNPEANGPAQSGGTTRKCARSFPGTHKPRARRENGGARR